MQRRRVLLVDDDLALGLEMHAGLELHLGAEVHFAGSVESGLERIHCGIRWDAAVFDMILPNGRLPEVITSSDELKAFVSRYGGATLALSFQRKFPGRPMAVWSIAPKPAALEPFVRAGVCAFFTKATALQEVVRSLDRAPAPKNVMRKIWDSVSLEPGAFGVSVNIKQLVDSLRPSADAVEAT